MNKKTLAAFICSSALLSACGFATNPLGYASGSAPTAAEAIADIHESSAVMVLNLANQASKKQTGKERFTQQQIQCYATTERTDYVQTVQNYLNGQFTQQEQQELNAYLQTPAGRKTMAFTSGFLKGLGGQGISLTSIPTPSQAKESQKFLATPLGKKWNAVISSQQHKSALDKQLASVRAKKRQACNIPAM